MPIAPKFPLILDDRYLYESLEDLIQTTRFHVKNIVLTNPGEKISDVNFGVGIRRYLFEPLTNRVYSNIRARVASQLNTYLSHVQILSIDIQAPTQTNYEQENSITMKLSYYIPIINESDILSFSVSNSTSIY